MVDETKLFYIEIDNKVLKEEWELLKTIAMKILENRGAETPDNKAVERLAEIMRDVSYSITSDAIGCSRHAKKDYVTEEDIELAMSFSFI